MRLTAARCLEALLSLLWVGVLSWGAARAESPASSPERVTRAQVAQLSPEALRVFAVLRPLQPEERVLPAAEYGRSWLLKIEKPREADALARQAIARRDRSATTLARLRALVQAGGTGLGRGYQPTVIDSVLVGLALQQAGQEPPSPLTAFLLSQQNEGDGGWPLAEAGPSRLEPSALVLAYLSMLEEPTREVRQAVERGLDFLHASTRPAALSEQGSSTVRATGWALYCLQAVGERRAHQAALQREALRTRESRLAVAPTQSLEPAAEPGAPVMPLAGERGAPQPPRERRYDEAPGASSGWVEVAGVQRGTARRLLVLVRAGGHGAAASEVARVRSFLDREVRQPRGVLTLVTQEAAFLEGVRSGLYDVYLVVELAGERSSAQGDAQAPETQEWARALTEQLFSGRAGLVVVHPRQEGEPALGEALGVEIRGPLPEEGMRFTAAPLQGLAALSATGPGVRLELKGSGATVVGYSGGSGLEAAAVVNGLGRGRSATFGMDLTQALPQEEAGAVLRRALEWVQPPPREPQPLSVYSAELSLSSRESQARGRTRALLPEGMAVLQASPTGSPSKERRGATWEVDLPAGGVQSHSFLLRLPEGPANATVLFEVEEVLPELRPAGLYPLVLPVATSGADLLARARQEAVRLPSSGPDHAVRLKLEALLLAVEQRAPTRREQVESNLGDLFRAVEETRKLRVDGTAVRLALGDLIGYWEARWATC